MRKREKNSERVRDRERERERERGRGEKLEGCETEGLKDRNKYIAEMNRDKTKTNHISFLYIIYTYYFLINICT